MERKIEAKIGDNLDSVVYTLLAAKARGEHVYCVFNNHVLHSDTVTMDSAYIEVFGYTKAEHERKLNEWSERHEKERKRRENLSREAAKRVNANRNERKKPITLEKVVKGLKFIAEHRSMSQEELVDGLIELGCTFSVEDIERQYPGAEEVDIYEGMEQCDISCAASIIANMRDSEFGRNYCDDGFLSEDNESSIYHFIRVVTGDESYTKENVDTLGNSNRRQR